MAAAEPKKPDLTLSAGHDAAWWAKEISRSWSAWKDARKRGEDVIKRYKDERESAEEDVKRFNILFSNVETLKPAMYSQVPVPDIRRRWQDKDPVGRIGATVLQRATTYCLESYDFHSVLKRVRDDCLLPGFAVARAKYKPYTQGEGAEARIVWHEALAEYVPWDRFLMSRAKVYERVWWAAVAEDLDRAEVEAQFGKDVALSMSYSGKDGSPGDDEEDGKARIWEVWNKRNRSRFYVSDGYEGWVKAPETDPLRLENFFPWPRPLWAVPSNDCMKPRPEYCQYEDQALELDDLTERIDVLTSALRRRGVYDAEHADLYEVLAGTKDNNFVGVNDWALLMQKGGLAQVAMEMPIEGVVAAIVQLETRRETVKQIIYEITGIGDVIRGASNPNETAAAQKIKGRWAGLRMSSRQADFAGFARDLIRIKVEIIAERFDAQTLGLMTGVNLPFAEQKAQWQKLQQQNQAAMQQWQAVAQQAQQAQQPTPPKPQIQQPTPEESRFYSQPTWEDVLKVIRDDKLRGYKIDIETDSTVQPDADTEKQARTELLQAVGGSAQQLAAAVQTGIITQEFAKELFAFTMRAFKAGSAVEEALDNMQQPQTLTPQQAQAEQQKIQQQQQQLAAQQQALAQQQQKAKDEAHKLELQKKDTEKAAAELQADRQLFALEQKHAGEKQQMAEQHAQQVEAVGDQAENVIKNIISTLPAPAPMPAEEPGEMEGAMPAKKPRGVPAGIRDIHIHTGGEKVEAVEHAKGPKKPRKVRIMDDPETGGMIAEEVIEAQEGTEGQENPTMEGAD